MPRPKPDPEDERIRSTISLPKKVVKLAERYLGLHPEEDLRDFSAVVSRALISYAEKKHPDLLAECIRDIRAAAVASSREAQPIAGGGGFKLGGPTHEGITKGRSTHNKEQPAGPAGSKVEAEKKRRKAGG